jgi:hypothetical protein
VYRQRRHLRRRRHIMAKTVVGLFDTRREARMPFKIG